MTGCGVIGVPKYSKPDIRGGNFHVAVDGISWQRERMTSSQHRMEALERLLAHAGGDRAAAENDDPLSAPLKVSSSEKRIPRPIAELKILYAVAVWGTPYIDMFLALALPGLLMNLVGLPNNPGSLFVIHTRPEDEGRFSASPEFQALKSMMPIVFRDIDLGYSASVDKYNVLNRAQSDAIALGWEFDGIVLTYADFVWSAGAIEIALKRLAEGYDAVVLPIPPLVREDFIEAVGRNPDAFYTHDRGYSVMNLTPRELVKLGKTMMHPLMRDNTVDYTPNTGSGAYVLWLGPNDDYLIRCFHIHPLILRLQKETFEFWMALQGTLDENFVPRILRAADRVYYVTDSDEAAIVSLTPKNFEVHHLPYGQCLNADHISHWAEAATAPIHRLFFDTYSIWHSHDVDRNAWDATIKRSEYVAACVRTMLQIPDSVLRATDKSTWAIREYRNSNARRRVRNQRWRLYVRPVVSLDLLGVEVVARIWRWLPEFLRRHIRALLPDKFNGASQMRAEKPVLVLVPFPILLTSLVLAVLHKWRQ